MRSTNALAKSMCSVARLSHYGSRDILMSTCDVSRTMSLLLRGFQLPGELQERFAKKQKRVSRFRQAMAHLAEVLPMDSVAATPLPRGTAE